MGCDIHLYREKFAGGKWVTADQWSDKYGDGEDVPFESRFTDRNYDLFGMLCKGARREFDLSFVEREMPLQPCPQVLKVYQRWEGDVHSASYLYLHELKELLALLQANTIPVSGMMAADQLGKLNSSIASGAADWNLLYPYCQSTNAKDYVDFSIDVPASFVMGNDLTRLIASFDGVDGENHRIVFWFDN